MGEGSDRIFRIVGVSAECFCLAKYLVVHMLEHLVLSLSALFLLRKEGVESETFTPPPTGCES